MHMPTLQGREKEAHLEFLVKSITALNSGIASDNTLNQAVYGEIARQNAMVLGMIDFLRYKEGQEDYHKNTGIYTEIDIAETGFPFFDSYIRLATEKKMADQNLADLPTVQQVDEELKRILFSKAGLSSEEISDQINKLSDYQRRRRFFQDIKESGFDDRGNHKDHFRVIETGEDSYKLVYTTFEQFKNLWLTYVVDMSIEQPQRKGLIKLGPDPKKQIYKIGSEIHVSPEIYRTFSSHADLGVEHMQWGLSRIGGVKDVEAHLFILGGFYTAINPTENPNINDLLESGGFLLRARKDCQSCTKSSVIGVNYEEKNASDLILPEEFIVCSPKLKGRVFEAVQMMNLRVYEA